MTTPKLVVDVGVVGGGGGDEALADPTEPGSLKATSVLSVGSKKLKLNSEPATKES